MLRHVRSHLNDKRFKCSYCPEAFVARESVKCHEMKYHTGKFTFTCETCGKGFYQTCNYKLHLRTHSGLDRYLLFFGFKLKFKS
jgi:KRAB domain-containing zinc finger protein